LKGLLFIQLGLIFASCGWNIYSYLNEMNSLTYFRMRVPELIEQQQSMEEDLLELEYRLLTLKSYHHVAPLLDTFSPKFYTPTSDQIFVIDRSCLAENLPRTTG